MSAVVPFPKLSETDRKRQLYAWADRLLRELGLLDQIEQVNSHEDLRKITFDVNAPDVSLAILAALHPENGQRPAECFIDVGKRMLQQILKARFAEAKRLRGQNLGRSSGAAGGTSSSTSTVYDWTGDLILDKEGAILPLLANLILFLRYHQKWAGVFALDEFANHVTIRKPPPWGSTDVDVELTDHHVNQTRVWFQREGIKAAQGDVGRAIQSAARDNGFHPVREFFNALVWDGTPQIDDRLKTYLHGAENAEYLRAVGPRFLIAVVARVFKPGCKADHALVLEGPQGKMKSELLCTLAIRDAWFTDHFSHIGSKDSQNGNGWHAADGDR